MHFKISCDEKADVSAALLQSSFLIFQKWFQYDDLLLNKYFILSHLKLVMLN